MSFTGGAPPSLSVVIPVRNGATTLSQQLEALAQAERPQGGFEVVVADNGSTDQSVVIALSFADRLNIRVIDASQRTGVNAARNRGVLATSAPWILFCDADDEVDIAWLVAMYAAFRSGHGILGGPIDYRILNDGVTTAWRGATRATVKEMHGFLRAGHGANMGVSRDVFDALGGFDEGFVHGGDDTEFFWRAQLAGFDLLEVPNAIVHYRLRQTVAAHFRQFVHYGTAEVMLYQRFHQRGLHRRPVRALLRDLWWLATRAPFATNKARRGAWARRFATQYGRLIGSVRLRTLWW
ncbi:MAG: glycosyltransferase [Actinomycetota bacterium]|nr:glycosyltransferase [Actinomycetota bacterium]